MTIYQLNDKLLVNFSKEPILIGSDEWYEFLSTESAFKFSPNQSGSFYKLPITVRSDRKKNSVYWRAYRKWNSKLRQEYIGVSENVTYERLIEVSGKLSLSDREYWTIKSNEKKARIKNKPLNYSKVKEELKLIVSKVDEKVDGYTINEADLLVQHIADLERKTNISR
ncbi:MAG: hypothetical protein WBA41_07775 [Rivularia sp. (in: cyanobacteria)]